VLNEVRYWHLSLDMINSVDRSNANLEYHLTRKEELTLLGYKDYFH